MFAGERLTGSERGGIAVDAKHAALRRRQQRAAVATAAERAIDEHLLIPGRQRRQHLGAHHRLVRGPRAAGGACHDSPPGGTNLRFARCSRARASASPSIVA